MLRQLEQDPGLGQGVGRVDQPGLQQADLLRPEPVEGPNGGDLVGAGRRGGGSHLCLLQVNA
jgi:hypothetical protein